MRRSALIAVLPLVFLSLSAMRVDTDEPPVHPLRRPVTPESVFGRGTLVFGSPTDRFAWFTHRGETHGFELELLRDFATGLDARVTVRPAESAARIVGWLQGGLVDVAFLPWRTGTIPGLRRLPPYVPTGEEGASPQYPETGALWVRNDSPELLRELSRFLRDASQRERIALLHERYHVIYRKHRILEVPAFSPISPYDTMIARHARSAGFDWRFVAALIFVESRFEPDAISSEGARGLMQIMPAAAREIGGADLDDPESNIRAGVRYLKRLSRLFSESEGRDHLATVLTAYLIGPGHVFDAQSLARDLGLDPNRWSGHLDQVLPLLENPQFYEETEHGFAQGRHALEYVREIFLRYREYRVHPASPGFDEARREPLTVAG